MTYYRHHKHFTQSIPLRTLSNPTSISQMGKQNLCIPDAVTVHSGAPSAYLTSIKYWRQDSTLSGCGAGCLWIRPGMQ